MTPANFFPRLSIALFVVALCRQIEAQERITARRPVSSPERTIAPANSVSHSADRLPQNWQQHPIAPGLKMALSYREHIYGHVRDFTCILAKRERIRGKLRDYEYLLARVRPRSAQSSKPLSIFLQFLGPADVKGRRVLYVEGTNNNEIFVRRGGPRFGFLTLNLNPESETAMRESNYPITQLGLIDVVDRMIERAHENIMADPNGQNTKVEFFSNAKVDSRSCTQIRVTHAQPGEHFGFHIANIFIDDELRVPIRVEGYGWPESAQGEPPLLEEFTYTKLKLNVGLSDADFDPSLIRS